MSLYQETLRRITDMNPLTSWTYHTGNPNHINGDIKKAIGKAYDLGIANPCRKKIGPDYYEMIVQRRRNPRKR